MLRLVSGSQRWTCLPAALAALALLAGGCEREAAAPSRPPAAATTPPDAAAEKRRFPEPEVCEVGATAPCEGEFCDEHKVPEAECKECLERTAKVPPAAGAAPDAR